MSKVMGKEEGQKLKESLDVLKNKFKAKSCKFCGDEIVFKEADGKPIPHDADGTPHWLTCPYGKAMKKKLAPLILRKLAVFLAVHHGIGFEEKAGLNKKETQVVHSILEYAFKETSEKDEAPVESSEAASDEEGLYFHPAPADPIGDPDEERAPDEALIDKIDPLRPVAMEKFVTVTGGDELVNSIRTDAPDGSDV